MRNTNISLLLFSLFSLSNIPTTLSGAVDYVLTDTGSTDGGNTFPGVSLPYGMAKLGPDIYTGSDSYSGYKKQGRVMGFSMTHETGTGGAPKYGVVAQMPALNPTKIKWDGKGYEERAAADFTEVGYYRTILKSGIVTELGATERAGIFNYTFPTGQGRPSVIVDVSHILLSYRGNGWSQSYKGGKIVSTAHNGQLQYQGWGDYDNGWNISPTWRIYFCGYFDAKGEHAVARMGATVSDASTNSVKTVESTEKFGMFYYFDKPNVISRVGISFISEEQACRNVRNEIPEGMTLDVLRNRAREVWESKVLSRVTASDSDEENLKSLYTSIYFMHLIPTNKTSENPKWPIRGGGRNGEEEPYWDDIFTFWDTFRCTTSLFHILQPEAYEEFIRSIINIYRHEGYMPDARSSFWNGATQGGSNADNVLADAYVKGVRGKINWEDGMAALLKDADVVPEANNDSRDGKSDSTKEGRGALQDWLEYGYLTKKYSRSGSRAVEYAVNDFSIYQVAKGLGLDNATTYLERSRNWRNQWNGNMQTAGFYGFIGPRSADRDHVFVDQDPLSCGGCYWDDDFYQGTPWIYSFNIHHDISTLISLSGGNEAFERRLNYTFNADLYDATNEPSFTTPYLYHFIGRPELSVYHSRRIAAEKFTNTPGGIPGNSDAGAMQSWLLWVMIGLYPLTGQNTFLIGSPWLSQLEITLDASGSKKVIINATRDGEGSYHVQRVRLNGRNWKQSWLTWSDLFENGGTLEFELGARPWNWATGALPPSPATEEEGNTWQTITTLYPGSTQNLIEDNSHWKRFEKAAIASSVIFVVLIVFGLCEWMKRKRMRVVPYIRVSRRGSEETTTSIPYTTTSSDI